tara:strand:- start:93 stop:500 length:408 start_codon:yes stop_codon:yes gene_type:complete
MFTQFNKTALIVATIILIVTLILISIFILKSISENEFPPFTNNCPDYWDISTDTDGNKICVNKSTINTAKNTYIDNNSFKRWCNTPQVSWWDEDGNLTKVFGSKNCAKYKWSKYCDLTWDGISDNRNVCKKLKNK